jgi:outer membrane protein insertion porin family
MKAWRGGACRRSLRGSWGILGILVVVSGLLLLGAAGTRAQVAEQSYAGYEGQKVSQVALSGPANTKLETFRSLLTQKEGAPFSAAAIGQSAAALKKTGLFSQVQVEITPEAEGLRVVFILQPATYIGMIRFPGAAKVFVYTRLLQAANIPEQAPYVQDDIPVAQKALQEFFVSEGFFQAQVDPEIQADQAHGIVNVIFKTDLKQRAKIGEINFDGLSPADSAGLRTSLKSLVAKLKGASIATGRKFTAQKMNKATEYVRARLIKGGHQAPNVRLLPPTYDAETNTAAVNFRVELGPVVSVKIEGARLWKRTIRHLVPIYEENAVDRDLVDEGKRNLISYFQSKGYYDVRVDVQMDQQPQKVDVVYQVHRGDHHNMEGIYFQGNRFFNDRDLRAHVLIKQKRFVISRGKYSDDLMRKSVNALTGYYNVWGFSKVVVTAKHADFNPQVDVTFTIVEGPQDKVATLNIVGNRQVTSKDLTLNHPLALGPGRPYSQRSLENDRNQILAGYLNRGFLNAGMETKVEPLADDPHKMNVTYTIQEGPQVDVSSLVYLGNDRTRTAFLKKIMAKNVTQGNALSEGRLLTSESDLYNLGIFDWTSVRTRRPISNQEQEDVLVKVHEAPLNTLDYGGGLEVIPRTGNVPVGAVAIPGLPPIGLGTKFTASQKNFVGPRLTLDYQRHDILGRAETASASVVFSRLDQRAAITYTDPYFRDSSWSTLFSVSAERTTQDPVFEARLGQASLQGEKALDAKHTKNLILRYSFQRTNLSNIIIPGLVLPQDQQVRLSMVSADYLHDTRDKPLDAHRGFFESVNVDYTAKALGSKYDFVRFLAQDSYYRPMHHASWVWANRVQLGMAKPFSDSDVPASERFFAGGAYTLRGFAINGAGPQRPVSVCANPAVSSTCTVISVPVGGNMLFVVNSEMRFPLKWLDGLGGVVFYDGGNVYSAINFNQLIKNYTNTIGVGLRYNTPVGPIRVDVGQNLNPEPGLKSTQYFITLGQSF